MQSAYYGNVEDPSQAVATRKVWAVREEVRLPPRRTVGGGGLVCGVGPRHLSRRPARSLRSLAEQGYGMEDVAVMFARHPRERLRRWAVEDGVADLFSIWGRDQAEALGPAPRLLPRHDSC